MDSIFQVGSLLPGHTVLDANNNNWAKKVYINYIINAKYYGDGRKGGGGGIGKIKFLNK